MRIVGFAAAIFATIGLISLLAWGISNKTPATSLSGFARVNHPSPIFKDISFFAYLMTPSLEGVNNHRLVDR